jgi:acetyltransferase-like isoleucine patch superfamily enzyme
MLGKMIGFYVDFGLWMRFCFWNIILRRFGGSIGRNVRIYDSVRLVTHPGSPIHIGDGVAIERGVVVSTSDKGRVRIGNHVYIGEYSVLTSNEEIDIGDNVLISPQNFITDFNHIFQDSTTPIRCQGIRTKKVTIQKDVWIGAGCKILMGVTVGEGAVIGAGAVVTQDVPPYQVVAGNPAEIIKKRN